MTKYALGLALPAVIMIASAAMAQDAPPVEEPMTPESLGIYLEGGNTDPLNRIQFERLVPTVPNTDIELRVEPPSESLRNPDRVDTVDPLSR